MLDQQSRHIEVTILGRYMYWRVPIFGGRVDFDLMFE
jgi:hypothetical protein